MTAAASWSMQQLTQLLVAVSGVADEATLARTVAEGAAEALEAEVGAVVLHGRVVASLGFAAGRDHDADVLAAGDGSVLHVPGVGPCTVLVAGLERAEHGRLVVARARDGEGWSLGERGLLRAMARVLTLSLRSSHVLTELHERQALLERLSRIQRSISARKPLQEVLDTTVAGAAELLGEDIVAVRLLDPADERYMLTASSTGVPSDLVAASRRIPVTEGVGGQAIREDRLVLLEEYASGPASISGFVSDGVRAAMAAPVRQGGRAVGSLTIATRRPDRRYSSNEQEVLVAFAEHAGLALTDARTVEALHRAVDEATHQALHDGLTALPNRALFLDRLTGALQRRQAQPFAVLFIDVDDFKMVNDGLGHLVGDQLLALAGERICAAVRSPDTVARLGGDEFAVLLEGAGDGAAETTAQRVLAALSAPFALPDGHTVHVGASIGLLVVDRREGSAEELLRDADVAMYHAKGGGGGAVVRFEPGMRARLQARTELEHELRHAVDRDELVVHYQPVVDLVARRVVGVEALARWQHPRRGLLSPAEFVAVAEETGQIVGIGAAVLRRACSDIAPRSALSLSVNLSPRQLLEPHLSAVVAAALRDTGLAPGRLVLEITESLLVQDGDASVGRLRQLKGLGVRLAVDDFGTGWSSLSYLSRLPVDALKIDRAFVAGLAEGGSQARITGAVIALAQALDLSTVAEGVEHEEQARVLVEQGATVVQGFAYAPPTPIGQLDAVIRDVEERLRPRVPHARRPHGVRV